MSKQDQESQGGQLTLQSVNDYIKADLVHSIHTSERRSFRGCRRRHNWIYRHRYYPTVTPKPLEFGVAYHAAMEVYYDPQTWDQRDVAASLALVKFKQVCKEQLTAYERMNGPAAPEVEEDYAERLELGLGMLRYYFKFTSPQYDNGFRPVKVEIGFEVPITGPNGETVWCKCDLCFAEMKTYWLREGYTEENVRTHLAPNWQGLPVTYGGRIDALVEDHDGNYWVVDWKTAARLAGIDPGAEDDFLYLDDQITSYCWALWVLGIRVQGFVYHEQKKAYPLEPEPLKRARLDGLFSQSKSLPTTYEVYKRTVEENDPVGFQSGAYDSHLAWLKEEGYRFENRRQIHRTVHELEEAGKNIYLEALDITDPNLRIYPSPGRYACAFCAFQQPCLGQNRGEDYEYSLETMFDKRERHYYQKQALSTDKPGRG